MMTSGIRVTTQPRPGLSGKQVTTGFVCSVVVILLFSFIQTISDLAPQSIKDGPMPGLFGLPIAILAIAWFTVIPIWFVVSIAARAINGKRPMIGPWILGAFAGLALGMIVMNYLPGPL